MLELSPVRRRGRRAGPLTAFLACWLLTTALTAPAAAVGGAEADLELWDDRFAVRVTYLDGAATPQPALVSRSGRQSAVLHFFHPTNPELLVKILDGRPINGHFWVFYGAITTLQVDVEVEDRLTGRVRTYRKAGGLPLGGADVEAFPASDGLRSVPGSSATSAMQIATAPGETPSLVCQESETALCLHGGRFRVTGSWRLEDPSDDGSDDPAPSAARAVRDSDRSGYLWFFDRDNAELLVKVLDGRPVNDAFWVLFGSATNLPFRLTVTDLVTGVEKDFGAGPFGGGADAFSFGPRGDAPPPPALVAPEEGAVVSPHDPIFGLEDAVAPGADGECFDLQIVESSGSGQATEEADRVVWWARCLRGETARRARLGHGEFDADHRAVAKLRADAPHRLRVRRRVATGEGSLAGPWAERAFRTGADDGVYPLFAEVASDLPAPTWTVGGAPVHLPDTSCTLRIESGGVGGSVPLLTFRSPAAGDAAECRVEARAARPAPVRVVVSDCVQRLRLPASEVRWRTPYGRRRGASLPPLDLLLGQTARFDVATGGSTFAADPMGPPPAALDPARLARHAASPWWLAPGLEIERVATDGLALPVNLTPAPGLWTPPGEASPGDPLFYVTELYGAVRVVRRDGRLGTYADGLLNFDPTGDFPGSGEMGLVGTVLDPETGDLLASLVYRTDPGAGPFELSAKVIRLPSEDGGRTAARVETLLDLGPQTRQTKSHQISHLSFGPDGMLYVHVGDGFAHQQAQILDNFAGKILRLRPDGTPPPDNPFYDDADGISAADHVFALGLRNPFGGAWGPDGRLYEVENGLSVDRFARVEAGFNYAWGAGGEGTDEQMRVGALFSWPEAVTPFDLLFVPEGTPALPESWWGQALVSEFGPTYRFGATPRGKRLALFDLAADPVAPRTVLRYDGLGPATVAATTLVTGTPNHDGLYFVDFFPEPFDTADDDATVPGARLWRVRATD